MAVHNGDPFLDLTLKSILSQTYENFELLIMNDGSTDDSVDIIRSFDDDRIKVFSQEQAGLAFSLNRLIERSNGELIARADADDIYLPKRLESQVQVFCKHPEVGVVGSFFDEIDEKGNKLCTRRFPVTNSEIVRYFRIGSCVMHPVVMFRKEIIERIGGYNETIQFAQDYDLWTRLSSMTNFSNVPGVLFKYRTHKKAISHKNKANQVSIHRRIRSAYWAQIEQEPLDISKWNAEINNMLNLEYQAFEEKKINLIELKKGFIQRRVLEANLAYGAKRPDIGIRCLFEILVLSNYLPFWISFHIVRVFGFNQTWTAIRKIFALKFNKIRNDNPTFEW